jgi:hypothetical protein
MTLSQSVPSPWSQSEPKRFSRLRVSVNIKIAIQWRIQDWFVRRICVEMGLAAMFGALRGSAFGNSERQLGVEGRPMAC